jgi:hypothetical protein
MIQAKVLAKSNYHFSSNTTNVSLNDLTARLLTNEALLKQLEPRQVHTVEARGNNNQREGKKGKKKLSCEHCGKKKHTAKLAEFKYDPKEYKEQSEHFFVVCTIVGDLAE